MWRWLVTFCFRNRLSAALPSAWHVANPSAGTRYPLAVPADIHRIRLYVRQTFAWKLLLIGDNVVLDLRVSRLNRSPTLLLEVADRFLTISQMQQTCIWPDGFTTYGLLGTG